MKYGEATTGQTEAVINRMGGFQNWLRFAGGKGKIVFDLLTLLRTVRVAAQPAVTTSDEYFKEAGVVWANDTFKAEFYGLEVPEAGDVELAICSLEEDSLDKPILDELGEKAEISVSQFRAFLAANRKSQEWFIFYLTGRNGKRAVDARWGVGYGGWGVYAYSVVNPHRWVQGGRVVSQVS